ncbi:MAG TPA: hypothetical protein VFO91_09340 [Anaerolineales bacterium]|nr:hypothetical protein [Anaerolineales bacterium]
MDDQPRIDRTIILPILLGIFSIFGILIIFLVGRLSAARASIPEEPTATPFKYIFLGTEPLPSVEIIVATGEDPFAGITRTPVEEEAETPTPPPALLTPTLGIGNTKGGPPGGDDSDGPPIGGTSPANTAAATTNPGSGPPPFGSGTYDDTHSYIVYDGPGWSASNTGGGTCGSAQGTQGTLHVSQLAGSSASFSYIGKEWRLHYQSGSGLGILDITVNGTLIDSLNQSGSSTQASEWLCAECAQFSNATHTVVLTHRSGGPVNVDCVIIPVVAPTGTPTATPTRTQTP